MFNIVSFVPTYAAAPLALYLLEQDVLAAAKKINDLDGQTSVIMPKGHEKLEELKAALRADIAVAEVDPKRGFVYSNDSACAAALRGLEPVPSAVTGSAKAAMQLFAAQDLLTDDESAWIYFAGQDSPHKLSKKLTVGELLAVAKEAGVAQAADPKAIYVGYPGGTLYSAEDSDAEIVLNSSMVHIYSNKNCMASALAAICAQYREETCGRCVFGHEGSHQINQIMQDICRKKGKSSDVALISDLAPVMQSQCLCEMGQIMASTTLSFFKLFGTEIEAHFTKKVCPAGECSAYMTYHILPTKCIGCGDCIDACEDEAILGKPRFIHVIDQKACTQCGACVSSCEEEAIIMAGADKPRTPPRPIPVRKR